MGLVAFAPPATAAPNLWLLAECGGERFAASVSAVRDLAPGVPARPLPEAPLAVVGMARVAGADLPVVDLGLALGRGAAMGNPEGPLLVLQVGARRLALRMDRVYDVAPPDAQLSAENNLEWDGGAAQALEPSELLTADNFVRLDQALRLLAESSGETDTPEISALGFELSGRRFAIDMAHVQAVARLDDLQPLPGVPPHFLGVTRFRGETLAIVELRHLFGLPSSGLHDNAWTLAVGKRRAEFGVLADAVHGWTPVQPAALRPLAGWSAQLPAGMARGIDERGRVLLHSEALLNHPWLTVTDKD